jgi:hypothetical protein
LDGRVNLLLQTPLYASGLKVHRAVEKLRNTQKIRAWVRNSALFDSLAVNREAASGMAISKLSEMLQAKWKLADLETELRAETSSLHVDFDLSPDISRWRYDSIRSRG